MITPQVATFSVYAYFAAALFGRQFLEPRGEHKSVTVDFYILLHLLRIGSLSIDRCNQFSNNCRSISSDDTTFPAVPNINFAASGPFANHTPGETELSLDFIFSEDKSAASQDK